MAGIGQGDEPEQNRADKTEAQQPRFVDNFGNDIGVENAEKRKTNAPITIDRRVTEIWR